MTKSEQQAHGLTLRAYAGILKKRADYLSASIEATQARISDMDMERRAILAILKELEEKLNES